MIKRHMAIRPAKTHAELHACVEMQLQIWRLSPIDAVPFSQLHAAHAWGGQVLVAIEADRLAGFCYAFGGRQYGKPALCSHMLAVLPECRGMGIGVQLKLAQGRWAAANGYDLITWTYDPLEAVNASLNIARLGGISRQYLVNEYGEMSDGLNQGLPSDRLLLEWHLGRPATVQLLAGEPAAAKFSPDQLRITIPRGLQQLKANDPAAALQWRLTVREALQSAFANDYLITGYQDVDPDHGEYLLTKENHHAH